MSVSIRYLKGLYSNIYKEKSKHDLNEEMSLYMCEQKCFHSQAMLKPSHLSLSIF